MARVPAAAIRLRAARPTEAPELSALALRSKGYWGYDRAFLAACREELTLAPDAIEERRVMVAVDGSGRTVGFATLEGEPPDGELGMLFVEPDHIGTGIGRLLWGDTVRRAATLGFRSLRIEADPGAAPFYEAMGARAAGTVPSGSIPGRYLPVLVYDVPVPPPPSVDVGPSPMLRSSGTSRWKASRRAR